MFHENDGTMQGVLGDGALRAGKGNMAMMRRAIKNGWPIDERIRRLVVGQMAMITSRSESERNKIAASRVLVAADAVTAKREAMDQADEQRTPTVHYYPPPEDPEVRKARLIEIARRVGVNPDVIFPEDQGKHKDAESADVPPIGHVVDAETETE